MWIKSVQCSHFQEETYLIFIMDSAKIGFMRKKKSDGSENPKYVDVLDEDKSVSGQKFVCVSFISPENILKQKKGT